MTPGSAGQPGGQVPGLGGGPGPVLGVAVLVGADRLRLHQHRAVRRTAAGSVAGRTPTRWWRRRRRRRRAAIATNVPAKPANRCRTIWHGEAHRTASSSSAVRRAISGAPAGPVELVDHPAVGEEQHPVGVRRRERVVGDHHDRLAVPVHRRAQQPQHLPRRTPRPGRRWARRRTAPPGRVTSARAIATRCCWPPDSSLGRCPARSARPTSASIAATSPARRPAAGQAQRQRHVLRGGQRRDQVERPGRRSRPARGAAGSARARRGRRGWTPSMITSPGGRPGPGPAAQCSRVDLPDPDGPITAVKVAAGTRRRRRPARSPPVPPRRRSSRRPAARPPVPLFVIVMPSSQPAGRGRGTVTRGREIGGIPSTTDRPGRTPVASAVMAVRNALDALSMRPTRFLRSAWPWRSVAYLIGGALLGLTTIVAVVGLLLAGLVLAVRGGRRRRVRRDRAVRGGRRPAGALADAAGRLATRCPTRTGRPAAPGLWAWLRVRLREQATWREFGYAMVSASVLCWMDAAGGRSPPCTCRCRCCSARSTSTDSR